METGLGTPADKDGAGRVSDIPEPSQEGPAPRGLLMPSDLGCLTWEKKLEFLCSPRSDQLPTAPGH